ncbi:MAG: ATP-binding protein, partial [Acidobacteriota bacterium]
RSRLAARAQLIENDFLWLLQEMERSIENTSIVVPVDRDEAFTVLAHARTSSGLPYDRLGLSLYERNGELVAWDGPGDQRLELDEEDDEEVVYRVRFARRSWLYAVSPTRSDGTRLVATLSITTGSPAVDKPDLSFLPGWKRAAPGEVHFSAANREDGAVSGSFERQGDRRWGLLGDTSITTLTFPLRDPVGRQLGEVRLKDRSPEAAADAWAAVARAIAALAAAATILAVVLMLRSNGIPRSIAARALFASLALWGIRWALLLAASSSDLPDRPLFDMSLFSSSSVPGLMRTPLDLLLTAVALLVQMTLVRNALIGGAAPRDPRGRIALGRAALLAAVLLTPIAWIGLHRFLDRLILDARIDLSRIVFDPHLLPRLTIQASIVATIAAAGLLLWSLTVFALRLLRTRSGDSIARRIDTRLGESIPPALRWGGGLLILTLLYVPFLHHAYDRMRGEFFELELMPELIDQRGIRSRILRDALDIASRGNFAAAATFARDDEGSPSSVALRLWSMTPLADRALASSLQIFEEGGTLLGRFAVDLAPMLEIPFSAAAEAAGGDVVTVSPYQQATVRKTILFGSRWLRPVRRPPLLVVISVVDDHDNLPILGSDSPFLPAIRGRGLTDSNPELLRFRPLIAVFGPHLERLHASGGEIPPPGPKIIEQLRTSGSAWGHHDVGDGPARILYATKGDLTYALARPHPGPLGLLATFLRHLIQNGLLGVSLLLLIGIGRGPGHSQRERAPGRGRFFRRLVIVFLLTALAPLLALATFVARISAREASEQVITAGLSSLQMARRVAEDYLTVGGSDQEPTLDDDVVFWLSQMVRHEISIFDRSELLATSVRELYDAEILGSRLGGGVYRALFIDREPFVVTEEAPTGFPSSTISAIIRIDEDGSAGVISIPLSTQRRAAARRIEQVADVILVSTCLMVILLVIAAWILARRVSEPIVHLAGAARRLADGELGVRVQAAARDEVATLVSAFNRMAGSLEEQQDHLRRRRDFIEMILRSATTGVVTIDSTGTIITINPAAQRLLSGQPDDPVVGDDLPARLRNESRLSDLANALERAQESGEERGADITVGRGSDERRLRAVFLPFAPEAGAPAGRIVLLEDVTEIIRSGRLSAWADMARRIAHEIKNPLTPMQLSVEHIRRTRQAGEPRFDDILGECLDNIQSQIGTLRAIASEFSAYARLPELRPESTTVEEMLDEALRPYTVSPPEGVEIECRIEPRLPQIQIDRAVIGRALINLIENALHAMAGGGTLTVRARADDGGSGRPGVCIEIRDNGVGIEPDLLPRLFEPYFSTRRGGTGLGLAIARRAVEEHGGSITIDSTPGQGTVVRLQLPIAAPPARGTE